MIRIASHSMFLLGSMIALTACDRGVDDEEIAEAAASSSGAGQAEASLLASAVDGALAAGVAPATPETVATFIATHAPGRYAPAGCATVTQAGLTVTIAFDQCTGPRGLRQLDGTLALTVAPAAGGAVAITAHAVDLSIGRATIDVDATAVYTVTGADHALDVTTHSAGIGPMGYALVHDGDYTATWDASCGAIDGAWSSARGDASRSTTVSVMRCLDACPTGTVTRTTVRGNTIELTFDGTATATWSSSAGGSGSFALPCGL